ncbi:MAG: hypothetical protein VYB09_01360 [Planctomycetota bacterium]|nr:hypothetical protein [Planctomycetota bacterium]
MAPGPPKQRRWLWRLLLLLAVLAGAGWLGWTWFYPAPADASPAAIGRWLAKRDLSRVSTPTRLALVNRLQELLLAEAGMSVFPDPRPDDLERLAGNVELLSHVWFLARGREYQHSPPQQRISFLRQQVDAVTVWGEFDKQLQDQLRRNAGQQPETSRLRLLDDIDSWILAEPADQQEGLRHALHDAVLCWLATSDLGEQEMTLRQEAAERISSALDSGAADAADRLTLDAQHQDRLLRNSWLLLEAWFRNRAMEFSELPVQQRIPFIEKQLDKVAGWQLDRVMVIGNADVPAESRPADTRLLEVISQLLAQLPDWIERAPVQQQESLAQLAEELKRSLVTYMLKQALPELLPGFP